MNEDIQLLNGIKNYLNKQTNVELGSRIDTTGCSCNLIVKWNETEFKITVERIMKKPEIKICPKHHRELSSDGSCKDCPITVQNKGNLWKLIGI